MDMRAARIVLLASVAGCACAPSSRPAEPPVLRVPPALLVGDPATLVAHVEGLLRRDGLEPASPSALVPLAGWLEHAQFWRPAGQLLGQRGGSESLAAVLRLLAREDYPSRCRALMALGHFRRDVDVVVPILLRHLRAAPPGPWRHADHYRTIEALGLLGLGAATAAPSLVAIYTDPAHDASCRAAAAETLGRIGAAAPSIVAVLLNGLAESDPGLRRACAVSLGRLGGEPERMVPSLVWAMDDLDWSVRGGAVHGLGRLGPNALAAVPALIRRLEEEACTSFLTRDPEGVRERAADALARIGRGAVPALVCRLECPEPWRQHAAARVLEEMGDQASAAIPALVARLGSKDDTLSGAAVGALYRIGTDAVPALERAVRGLDAEAARRAAYTLDRISRDAAR